MVSVRKQTISLIHKIVSYESKLNRNFVPNNAFQALLKLIVDETSVEVVSLCKELLLLLLEQNLYRQTVQQEWLDILNGLIVNHGTSILDLYSEQKFQIEVQKVFSIVQVLAHAFEKSDEVNKTPN